MGASYAQSLAQETDGLRMNCEVLLTPSQEKFLFGNTTDGPSVQSTQSGVSTWPGGVVPYAFHSSVSAIKKELFVDAASEISSVAGVSFVPRNGQQVYALIKDVPGLNGGNANLGRPSNTNAVVNIGSESWSRFVLAHELGHLIGLIHEHQRSDRDQFIQIECQNLITAGDCTNQAIFGRIKNSIQTGKPYDFDSRMHYFDTASSKDPQNLKTIIPKPGYEKFAGRMGTNYHNFWTPGDRFAMTTILGYGPPSVPLVATVTNTKDSGPGSLRAALYYAQDHEGTKVLFRIPKSDPGYQNGVFTIRLSASLYGSGTGTDIDGTSQTQFTGDTNTNGPEIAIRPKEGLPSSLAFNGMIMRDRNVKITGISIGGFKYNGVLIDGLEASGNTISQCHIGCGPDGATPEPNEYAGIRVSGGADESVISGNVLSGNTGEGVHISDEGSIGNIVQDCIMGLNRSGDAALRNGGWGVRIDGGAAASVVSKSIISGNPSGGIMISDSGTDNSKVQGNIIGLDKNGMVPIENESNGIVIQNGAKDAEIGPDNVVSGNRFYGVALNGSATERNSVFGNVVGLSKSRISPAPNGYGGIGLWAATHNNVIGGALGSQRNVISGNTGAGITVMGTGTDSNQLVGNWIGINKAGDPSGNSGSGISFYDGPSANEIGGSLPGEGNVIAANNSHGIIVWMGGSSANRIRGNFIGINRYEKALGNEGIGIYGLAGSSGTQIGGTAPGDGNMIHGNTSYGILLDGNSNLSNSISGNSIGNNRYEGIALSNGANQSLGKPVLTSAILGLDLVVNGSAQLSGVISKPVVLEFFASDEQPTTGFEQGEIYLGADTTSTNTNGAVSFVTTLQSKRVRGKYVTATLRLVESGDTSGFSNAVAVSMVDPDNDGLPSDWENFHGLNANNPNDAGLDLDADGFTSLQEFYLGTDPKDSHSLLSLTVSQNLPDHMALLIKGAPGISLRVYRSETLKSGDWELLTVPFISVSAEFSIKDKIDPKIGKRFYRAEP